MNVHESVIARIATGTDNYAPIALPGRFRIVPAKGLDEALPQADSEASPGRHPASRLRHSLALTKAVRRRLALRKTSALLSRKLETAWDIVWCRRLVYFLTVAVTLAILIVPMLRDHVGDSPAAVGFYDPSHALLPNDGRTSIFTNLFRLPAAFLPELADHWLEDVAAIWKWILFLLVGVWLLNRISVWLSRITRDLARASWLAALGPTAAVAANAPEASAGNAPAASVKQDRASILQDIRNSSAYQHLFRAVKWYVLPFIIGIIMLLLLAWAILILWTQMRLPNMEDRGDLCASGNARLPISHVEVDFRTDRPCNSGGGFVQAGQTYIVTFDVIDQWRDADADTTPSGGSAFAGGLSGFVAAPLRRIVDANYLQPLVSIRPNDSTSIGQDVYIYPLALTRVENSGSQYRAEFTPRMSGSLSLFANDAVLPYEVRFVGLDPLWFYHSPGTGNAGTACVTIERVRGANEPPAPANGPGCTRRDEVPKPVEQSAGRRRTGCPRPARWTPGRHPARHAASPGDRATRLRGSQSAATRRT